MMHIRYKGFGPLRLYRCEYYTVEAPPTACFFCKHLTDVYSDHINGPYMFFCDLLHNDCEKDPDGISRGLCGECPDFEEA